MPGVETITIPTDHKFAVVGLPVIGLNQEITFPLRADGSRWATSTPPVKIDRAFRDMMGLRADHFEASSLFLLAQSQSSSPAIFDGENLALARALRHLSVALGILGFQFGGVGTLATGCRLRSGELLVRSVEDTARQHFLHPHQGFEIDESHLARAARIGANIDLLDEMPGKPRLWRGVRSLASALEAGYGAERLHFFVRSLDGIIKTPRGRGKEKFIERCQVFVGQGPEAKLILAELYDLRSAVEHLHPLESVLGKYDANIRQGVANQRTLQAEVLARFVYAHILGSEERTRDFASEASIDGLWNRADAASIWGEVIDILGIGQRSLKAAI